MKKLLKIIFSILAVLFFTVVILGIETRYFYTVKKDSEDRNIEVLKNQNFTIKIDAVPNLENKKSVNVILIFDKIKSPIKIESALIELSNKENKFYVKKVIATDGFYSWVEERNGSANSFENLPESLKIIDKDLKAYYTYSWTFVGDSEKSDQIKINLSLSILNVEGEKIKISKIFKMEKSKEIVFRNPIRFH